jgi:lipopolysaccharide transport system permease protein
LGQSAVVTAADGGDSHFDSDRVTVIRPHRGWVTLGLKDLWDYRDLLQLLVWRDIKIRYKQTAIGALWAIIQPVATMIVFTIVFGHLAKLPTGGVPYPILTFTALLPWQFFVTALTASTSSVVSNQALVTKVYFPRLVIPIGPVFASLLDFMIGFGILVVLMIYYHVHVGIEVLTLPVFILFAMLTSVTVGIWLSGLNVRYRDVQYLVPFLTQFWFYATPIAYSTLLFPPYIRPYLGLNPMAGVVSGFRWALLGHQAAQVGHIVLISFAMVIFLLFTGIAFFRRVEKSFADVI